MPINVKVGGVWTPVVNVWAKVSGTWRVVSRADTRVAGVWTKIFGGGVAVTDPTDVASFNSGILCTSGFRFQTDGGLDEIGPILTTITAINVGEWWDAEPQTLVGENWRVRCASLTSGSWNFQAAAVGDWVRLSAARDWRVLVTEMNAPDTASCTAVFEIAPYPSGAAVATFTLTAEATN